MAVELNGNVRMRGDTGPGVGVRVLAERRRLRLLSGSELVGDWIVSDIGIVALQDGFNIKAEGEEFVLRTEDDVALADEIGVSAVSPRLARRLAARHNPEERQPPMEPEAIPSNLAAIGFAVAGALVVLGGTFLNGGGIGSNTGSVTVQGGPDYWLLFVVGGSLMIASAYVMSVGTRMGRAIAGLILLGMVITFGLAVAGGDTDVTRLSAYGFVAGGLVVGIAVLFSGSLGKT